MGKIIKKYPISCALLVLIWVACFIDVPDTPLKNVTLIDKWTHITMYLVLGLAIGWEGTLRHRKADVAGLVIKVLVLPALMGGLIEVLQANCTGGRRSGEWLDFAADAVGAAVALAICIPVARCRARA